MSHFAVFRPEGVHAWGFISTWSVMVPPLWSSSIWFISLTWRWRPSSLYCVCLSVCVPLCVCMSTQAFFGRWGVGGGGVHDVAFGVTRTLRVVCAVVCAGERQGNTAWSGPGMCDVGRLYNRAGLPEGGQWDGCHPPAPSPLGDDHYTTLQVSGPLNRRCNDTRCGNKNTCMHWKTCVSHRHARVSCVEKPLHDHTHTQRSFVYFWAPLTNMQTHVFTPTAYSISM